MFLVVVDIPIFLSLVDVIKKSGRTPVFFQNDVMVRPKVPSLNAFPSWVRKRLSESVLRMACTSLTKVVNFTNRVNVMVSGAGPAVTVLC